ncbi:MAG: response regulator [Bacteroidales bacterium]|nr:response regulator [Bacteroidales bacterium]
MGYKILVVDDSPAMQMMIGEVFGMVGDQYKLIFAENGREGCEKAFSEEPDLILMDAVMPEVNGIEALKILKNDPRTQEIPVIVLSASETIQNAFEAGASDFINKPFKHYELVLRVKSAINLVEKVREIKAQKEQLQQQKKRHY